MTSQSLSPLVILWGMSIAAPAVSQGVSYTLYGTPGLIEMPTARSDEDGQLATSAAHFEQQTRGSVSFQVTPRLSGTFRYSKISRSLNETQALLDRSFDLRYRIFEETDVRPAVAIGLQDFLGTGALSSEYVVATKGFGDSLDVTMGLGWGRFGSHNGFRNPLSVFGDRFEERPNRDFGFGGRIESHQFFHGNAALFAGVEYQLTQKWRVKAEYSSDGYVSEVENGIFDHRTPINLGVSYRWRDNVQLSTAFLHGSELAFNASILINPNKRPNVSGLEKAPQPVRIRPKNHAHAAHWGTTEEQLVLKLKDEGIRLVAYDVRSDSLARVRYTNNQYRSEAQAMGRVARILSAELPPAVEVFVLEPMQKGIPLTSVQLKRSDLETFEHRASGSQDMLRYSKLGDAHNKSEGYSFVTDEKAAFLWGISPYAELVVFNANDPAQLDGGLDFTAQYKIAENIVVSGKLRYGFRQDEAIADEFQLENDFHNVRTDARFYGRGSGPTLENLTVAHYDRPSENLYSRVSAGYLEDMYGGISAELLWKPIDQNFAVGAELNYVKQREFEQGFGFQDYEIMTGHVSGYYKFDNGFHTQVDLGRYLAGDWGATFSLQREFANGWQVGGYVTLTDMPFDQFGEGSFDKGIQVTIPTDFFLGTASRQRQSFTLSSLKRDGGARVGIDGRLYNIVRDGHLGGHLGQTWGRFWK